MGLTQPTGEDLKDGTTTDADIAAANKDGAAGTPSMRTLGTGAAQACAGNDSRLSNTRDPNPHVHVLADLEDLTDKEIVGYNKGGTGPPARLVLDGVTLDMTSEVISWMGLEGGDIECSPGTTNANISAGVLTSAARTVTDDATVADMVNTLGGESSTGTGGLVRKTSPTLTTPAVDLLVSTRLQTGDSGGQPRDVRLEQRRSPRWWLKNPSATTYSSVGMISAPTVTTSTAVASGDTLTRPYVTIDTAASTNSFCEVITATFGFIRRCWSPTLVVPVRTPATITNVRHWIGFGNQSLNAVGAPTTQHVAAFRYDTGVDGTVFWRCVTCNGASGVTTTTTAVAYAASTEAVFRIEMDAAVGVSFYIDDVRVALHTTNLPGNTTNMGFASTVTTLNSTAKDQRVGTFTLLHT